MGTTAEERNGAFVLEAFDAPANRRDFVPAKRFWSLIKASPPDRRHENALAIADSDYVTLHGRLSTTGPQANRIAVDIVRLEDGLIAEHWGVVQDEATAEESKSRPPMFGDTFPTRA